MAYLTIARISGDPDRLLDGYQQTADVMSGVGRDHGLIAHAAARTGEGLVIVNLWPSPDRSEAAAADPRRRAVIAQHALDPGQFHYEHHEGAAYELFPTPGAERLQVGADELVVWVRSEETGGALFASEVRMAPGGGPPVMHRHPAGELYDVLQGELAFYLADDARVVHRSTAAAGAVVPIAGGRSHTIRNESPAEAVALVVHAPGAPMEAFVHAVSALTSPEEVLACAQAHGIELTGTVPWQTFDPRNWVHGLRRSRSHCSSAKRTPVSSSRSMP